MAPLEPRLTAQVARFVREHRLPGASVGIVRDGSLAWAAGVGFADLATGARPNERTLYRIASITKTFTATAVLQLRDEGRLRLDDTLTKYVPVLWYRVAWESTGKDRTRCHLSRAEGHIV
jgi:CubicO group peptidase (beta-lactamase class C family)